MWCRAFHRLIERNLLLPAVVLAVLFGFRYRDEIATTAEVLTTLARKRLAAAIAAQRQPPEGQETAASPSNNAPTSPTCPGETSAPRVACSQVDPRYTIVFLGEATACGADEYARRDVGSVRPTRSQKLPCTAR